MATNIPYNLQFSSYANFRDPNYQQIQQMLGSERASEAMEADIAAQEREETYGMWEAEFEEEKETSELEREALQLEIDNMAAMYSELEQYYSELFSKA